MISGAVTTALMSEIAFAVTIPILLVIILKIRTKTSLIPAFAGCMAYLFFGLELTGLLHGFFMKEGSAIGDFINSNVVSYTLYVVLVTAVLEETGRLVCFKYILRNHTHKRSSLMFGIGYAGLETALVVGLSAFLNLAYASVINELGVEEFVKSFEGVEPSAVNELVETIQAITVLDCVAASVERIICIIIQVALSVICYYAVSKGLYIYYGIAIVMHMIVNIPSSLVKYGTVDNAVVAELIIAVLAAGIAYVAIKLYREFDSAQDPFLKKYAKNT